MRRPVFQKQRERFLLERFLESLGLNVKKIEERETPDFLVCFEDNKVGIELTDLFIVHNAGSHLPQVQESVSDKVVSLAQRLYQKSLAPPVHVSICFYPSANLKSLNRDKAAEMLSTFVHGLNLSLWQVVNWRPEESEDSQLPEEISFIHAIGVPSYEMAHWTTARAGWVAPLTIQTLQARIDKKSKKLKEYQNVVAENWLVIISNGTKPSQLFYVPPEFDPKAVSSLFSKTFYYSYPDRTFIKLGK